MFTRAPDGGCASAPTETLARQSARVCAGRAPSLSPRLSLEESSLPLADADAECREAVPAAAAPKLVQQRHDEARAGHPERVAECDRAAVDVHIFRIQAQLTDDHEALRGEGLVQLDEVEFRDLHAAAGKCFPHGRNRPDPHHTRVDTGNRRTYERPERLGAERPRLPLRGHDD